MKIALFSGQGKFEGLNKSSALRMWRKQVLSYGHWVHPMNKEISFEVTPAVVDQIISNFNRGIPVDLPVVMTHTDDPRFRAGSVRAYIKTDRGLDVVMGVSDEEMNGKIEDENKAPGVSCWLDLNYDDKQSGIPVGAVVKHVALVNHPYIEGMGKFEAVLSENGVKEEYVMLVLSESSKAGGSELGDAKLELSVGKTFTPPTPNGIEDEMSFMSRCLDMLTEAYPDMGTDQKLAIASREWEKFGGSGERRMGMSEGATLSAGETVSVAKGEGQKMFMARCLKEMAKNPKVADMDRMKVCQQMWGKGTKLSEVGSKGENIMTKDEAIQFLKDSDDKIDVTQLLADAVEYKKLHDRIDNGELVVKDDVDMSLSDELVKQVSDHMVLSEEDKKNPGAVIAKLIAKIVELAGTKTAVVDLQKQLSEMRADQEVGLLLSEKKIFPAEASVFKKMWVENKGLYDEMAKVRVKPLIELSEIGSTVNEVADEKVIKEKKTSEEIARHFDAAKKERLVK